MDTFKLNLQLEASDDDIAKIKMVANAGSVRASALSVTLSTSRAYSHTPSRSRSSTVMSCPQVSVIRPLSKQRTANYLSKA